MIMFQLIGEIAVALGHGSTEDLLLLDNKYYTSAIAVK